MAIFDHGPDGQAACFQGANKLVVARTLDEVIPALQRAEDARRAGAWIAGWIGYEAGFAFEDRLRDLPRGSGPLLALGVFDAPVPVPPHDAGAVRLAPAVPRIDRSVYDRAFVQVQDYIAAGDCYQVNLTFPMDSRILSGTPRDVAAALAALQPVGFGSYLDMGVGPVVVSRSPELFFKVAEGRIEARPMKGTAPRATDPAQDAALKAELAASVKNRAENLMIVDLLRNDISRIAKVGTVRVPDLYTVESFATVHQMTSRVTAELSGPPSLPMLMRALFPCGSITGAPKVRAMQIIAKVEAHPRDVYCGAIGWMGPDDTAAWSVAIRTLSIDGTDITLNVGGGVVADSTAEDEWEEALWKARYITPLTLP